MRFMVIFEKGKNSYGAYAPNLPGCVAAGETMEEVRRLIAEAIAASFRVVGRFLVNPCRPGLA